MKLRAIVNGVSFYTTSTAIKQRRSGDFSLQNEALAIVLERMGKDAGLATTIRTYDNKMRVESYDIQLTRI